MARTHLAALLIFLSSFLVYLFPFAYDLLYKPFFTISPGIDVVPAALLPVSFLERGDFYLDPFSEFFTLNYHDPFFVAQVDGHLVSRYPIVAAVLATPFYGVPLGEDWLTHTRADWLAYPRSALFLARVPAAFITSLAVLMFFFCAHCLTDLKTSASLAIIFAFGTSVWTTASQALWQHTPSLLLLLIGVWFVLRGARHGAMASVPGAFFISTAVVARANNLFAAAALTLYVCLKWRPALVRWALCAIPPLLAFLWYNTAYNGAPLVFGYQAGFVQTMSLFRFDGLMGIFISPSRGLLVYSPFLIFAFIGFRHVSANYRSFYLAAGAILVLNVYTLSLFQNWDGGWGYGTRLLVDALPFAMFGLIPALERLRGLSRWGFWALVAFSSGLQILGLWDYGEHWHWHWENWNYNVWDVAENEPLYYFKQYWEMAIHFLSRLRA